MNTKHAERLSKLEKTNSLVERLKKKVSECNKLKTEINSLTDMEKLLKQTNGLFGEIDQISRNAVQSMEQDWVSVTDYIKHLTNIKIDILGAQIEIFDADQMAELSKDMPELKQAAETLTQQLRQSANIGKNAINLILVYMKMLYVLSAYSVISSLEKENILSKSDLQGIKMTVAEWIRTAALDLVPYSGLLLKILNSVSKRIAGTEIEKHKWDSWTDKMRRERSFGLLERSYRKALAVGKFYEYHFESIMNAFDFAEKVLRS